MTTAAALRPAEDPIASLPILILEPHARCNCRCLMCDIWKVKEPRQLTAEEVGSWLPDLRALGVTRVVLTGGEALLHSDLWGLAAPLVASGIGLTLLSSGLLLKRDAAEIAEYVDDVIVSLDGPREVHDEIRNVPRAFDRLAEGVAALRARKPDLPISARCTVQRRNVRHLREVVRAARAIGLDRISFLAADVSSEAFNRSEGWSAEKTSDVALSRPDLLDLAAELEAMEQELADDFRSGFIAESPAKLRTRVLQHFEAVAGLRPFVSPTCNAPWVSAVVESNGDVKPCFFQPAIGNVREGGGLASVLNSERALAFRRSLSIPTNQTCQRCVCSLALRSPATTPPGVRGAAMEPPAAKC